MIVHFFYANRKRRRIARAERLVKATLLLIPTFRNIVTGIAGVYRGAWRGPHYTR